MMTKLARIFKISLLTLAILACLGLGFLAGLWLSLKGGSLSGAYESSFAGDELTFEEAQAKFKGSYERKLAQ